MTPEQEIAGLKVICNAWKADSEHYANGLREVRKQAMQHYDVSDHESDRWLDLISSINGILSHENQCGVCGDHHEPDNIPRGCETGDGF